MKSTLVSMATLVALVIAAQASAAPVARLECLDYKGRTVESPTDQGDYDQYVDASIVAGGTQVKVISELDITGNDNPPDVVLARYYSLDGALLETTIVKISSDWEAIGTWNNPSAYTHIAPKVEVTDTEILVTRSYGPGCLSKTRAVAVVWPNFTADIDFDTADILTEEETEAAHRKFRYRDGDIFPMHEPSKFRVVFKK